MKTTLLTSAILAIGTVFISPIAYGQIPNYNFETWSNGANSAPDGWEDHGSAHPGFYPAIQTNDKYLGSYAVRLENKITATDTTRGNINTIRPNGAEGFGPAFPIATRYNNLKGFYKYTPLNGDSALIMVYITKTGYVNPQYPQWGILLAFGQKNMGATPTYSPFSVGYLDSLTNFYYFDNVVVPDSAYIDISAYKAFGPSGPLKPLGNSILYVDALNFDSYLSGVNETMNITTGFCLYPNSNNGNFNVVFETSKTDYTTITIYDLEGRKVKDLFNGKLNAGLHSFQYDLRELNNGNYLYMVATAEGYKVEKLTIQR